MYSILDIEKMDLNALDRKELSRIKGHLLESYYLTSSKELAGDGKNLKDLIRKEYERFLDFIMNKY